MRATVLIGADIVPTKSNFVFFRKGNVRELVGDKILQLFHEVDFSILNLEVSLTDKETPIAKCGPNLIASTDTVVGIKALGVSFLTLANNHILDQNVQGLFSTIGVLNTNGIAHAGAGNNLREASEPYIANVKGIRVGIYCCAEHEYSIAGENSPGANPFDPLESFDHVRALREQSDLLIVLYHGGKEHYRYPSPNLRKVFRKFALCGADFVIAQHTHCVGCVEKYRECHLVYGQGNFLFDYSDSEFWQTALLLLIETDGNSHECKFVPLRKHGQIVRIAEDEDSVKIMEDFQIRSLEIVQEGFVERRYAEFSETMRNGYLQHLSGRIGSWLPVRVLNRLCGRRLFEWNYDQPSRLAIENYMACEAHREVVLQAMRVWRYRQINNYNINGE